MFACVRSMACLRAFSLVPASERSKNAFICKQFNVIININLPPSKEVRREKKSIGGYFPDRHKLELNNCWFTYDLYDRCKKRSAITARIWKPLSSDRNDRRVLVIVVRNIADCLIVLSSISTSVAMTPGDTLQRFIRRGSAPRSNPLSFCIPF